MAFTMRDGGGVLLLLAVCAAAIWLAVSEAMDVGGTASLLWVALGCAGGLAAAAFGLHIDPRANESSRGSALFLPLSFLGIGSVPFWDQLPPAIRLTMFGVFAGLLVATTAAISLRMSQHHRTGRRAPGS